MTNNKIKAPHTLVLIFGFVVVAAIFTHIIPTGSYDRIEMFGKKLVVSGTYKAVAANPQGVTDVLMAVIKGMVEASEIIFIIFMTGGAIGVLTQGKVIESSLGALIRRYKDKNITLILVIIFVGFCLGGTTFGMAEESLPFALILLSIFRMAGYDSLTVAALIFLGTHTGVLVGTIDPFSVLLAQKIAGLEPNSGLQFRAILLVVFATVILSYILFYARKVKKDPKLSLVYEEDQNNKIDMNFDDLAEFTTSRKLAFVVFIGSLALMVWGIIEKGWYMQEIAALFFTMGVVGGLVARMPVNDVVNSFINGAKDLVGVAFIVGMARALVVVTTDGHIIDTILHSLEVLATGVPQGVVLTAIMLSDFSIALLSPSTTGVASLTMPIFAPLADLINISKQSVVLAYQYGITLGNMMTPTSGVLMGILGIAKVPYTKWLRFLLPLFAIIIPMAIIALYISTKVWVN